MTITQNQKLVLHTNGPIDPASWELFGVSAKFNKTPIGRFGSGFSIAIAGLLRLGNSISIYSEGKEYHFGLEDMDFRGEIFKRITCNGKALGFTTLMGQNWEPDHFYRELISNCMDEDGIWFLGEPMIGNGTSIVVSGPTIIKSHANHDKIFIGDREPLAETKYLRIYKGAGDIFYRGVKIGHVERAVFDYEMIKETAITEDRTLQSEYCLRHDIGFAFTQQLEDEKLLKQLVMCSPGFEDDCDWDWQWSDALKKVVSEVWTDCPTKLSSRLIKLKITRMPGEGFTEQEMSEDQSRMFVSAKAFLADAGYEITAPVQLIKNTDDNNIAFAYRDKIYLTERSFAQGLFHLVTVLFEERSHVIGHDDYSRSFQTYLIKELITHARKHLKLVL